MITLYSQSMQLTLVLVLLADSAAVEDTIKSQHRFLPCLTTGEYHCDHVCLHRCVTCSRLHVITYMMTPADGGHQVDHTPSRWHAGRVSTSGHTPITFKVGKSYINITSESEITAVLPGSDIKLHHITLSLMNIGGDKAGRGPPWWSQHPGY